MSQEKFDEIVKAVQTIMEEQKVPGITIGVVDGDQTYTTGLGVTNADNPLDVTNETLFQIGSATKTFTATALMILAESGKIDFDAPVRQYLPDFKVADESVAAMATVRHLVTHSAGWVGDVFDDTGNNDDALRLYVDKMAELEQLAPPDTLFSYNNAAFCVAGRVIEVITEKPYEEAIKELIFEPLGLERSFFFPRDLVTFRFAVGHIVIEDQAKVQRPWAIPRSSNAAGGIACHVQDLLSYARFYMGDGTTADGTRLLSEESMKLMQTPQFPMNDEDGDIGLSWWIKEINGIKTIGHGGGTLGQTCDFVIAPQQKFAVAILTNASQGGSAIKEGVKTALKEFLDIEDTPPTPIEATVEQLEVYVGKYTRPVMDTEVTLEGNRLIAQISTNSGIPTEEEAPAPPPISMTLCGEDQLVVTEGMYKDMRVEFIRKEDGSIGWMRLGARINNRVEEEKES